MKIKILVFIFCFSAIGRLFSQDSLIKLPVDSILKPEKNYKLLFLPLLFYTPETKFGAGVASIFTFKFKNDSKTARPSSLQLGYAYTQYKQVLLYLPFQLWLKDGKYNINGEFGYYKYNYFFWGVGTKLPFSNQERYDVNYPLIRINALRRVAPNFYVGLRFNRDDFRITKVDSTKQLVQQTIVGSQGGSVSSQGIALKYDNRDSQFFPTKGYFGEFTAQFDSKKWGSSYNFVKFVFDGSTYFKNKFKHVLALNIHLEKGNGSVPFNDMALLGGTKRMRGFYSGRYRDKNCWIAQAEYRVPLFWRLGMVGFISAGDVAPIINSFKTSTIKVAYGTGLRIMLDKKQKINLRIDIAWADPKPNFYLTLTEAF
jgi:outer membrane protein assembly factor BamA